MRINIPTKSLSSNSGVGAENNNSTTAAGGNVKSLSVPELNITSDTFSKSTAKRQSRQKSSDTKPAMSNTATAEADETHDSVSELMFRSGSSMNMLESPVDSHSRLSSASSLNLIKQSIFFKPSANRIDQRLQPASNSLSVNDNLLLSTSMTTAPLTAAAGGNFSYANASYNFSSLSGIQDDREIEIASHPSELEEGNSGHVEHGAAQFSKSLPKSEANNADSFGQASRANTSNLLENHLSLQQQKLELNSSSMPNINSSSVAAPHSPSSTRNSTASFSTRMRKNTPATSSTSSIVIGEKSLGPLLVQPLLFRKFSKEIPEILFNDLNIHETYAYEADMEDFSQHGINAAVIEIKNVYLWEAPNHAITCEISSKSGKTEIKTASVPALVHALVAGNMTTDHDFLTDFLRTYRYFSNSIDIARLLIMSYIDSMSISKTEGQKVNSNTSNSTASSAKQMTLEDRSAQIQFKILNVFKKWISEQPADFELDSSFSQLLIHFLDLYVQKDEKKGVFAVKMLEQMDALLYNSNYNNAASPGSQVSSSVPRPAIPKQIPSGKKTFISGLMAVYEQELFLISTRLFR